MRIKKTSETTPRTSQTVNQYNNSTTDSYSCNYINELNEYSTTEQRIGTWIDGKPLYRKVINTTTINSTNNWVDYDFNVYGIPNNLSMLCFKNCYFERTQNNDIVTENYETTGYRLQANLTYNKISILGTGYSYDRLYMIIEYTKTTD